MAHPGSTRSEAYTLPRRLYIAFGLSANIWRITASDGTSRVSQKSLEPGDRDNLLDSIERMRKRFGLTGQVPVCSSFRGGA